MVPDREEGGGLKKKTFDFERNQGLRMIGCIHLIYSFYLLSDTGAAAACLKGGGH